MRSMSSFRSGSRDLRSIVRVHEARGRRKDGGPRRCARAPLPCPALPCMSRPARTHHAAPARRKCKAQQPRARSQRASHNNYCLVYALSDRVVGKLSSKS